MATSRYTQLNHNEKVLSLKDFQLLETFAADILREPKLAEIITRYVDDRELWQSTLKQELFYLRDFIGSESSFYARLDKAANMPIDSSPSRAVIVETAKRLAQKVKS